MGKSSRLLLYSATCKVPRGFCRKHKTAPSTQHCKCDGWGGVLVIWRSTAMNTHLSCGLNERGNYAVVTTVAVPGTCEDETCSTCRAYRIFKRSSLRCHATHQRRLRLQKHGWNMYGSGARVLQFTAVASKSKTEPKKKRTAGRYATSPPSSPVADSNQALVAGFQQQFIRGYTTSFCTQVTT